MSETTKKHLIDDLNNNICYVILQSHNPEIDYEDDIQCGQLHAIPLTTCDKQNDVFTVGELPDADDDNIVAWSICDDKHITFKIDDVIEWTMKTQPLPEDKYELDRDANPVLVESADVSSYVKLSNSETEAHDWDAALVKIKHDLHKLQECCDEHDMNKLAQIRFRNDVDETGWEILRATGFCCNGLKELRSATPEQMQQVREGYMNYIRQHRSTAFEELDQLEQEAKDSGGSDEDIQDIDMIKQMFRDIPQDTDLNQYNNAHELLKFWPSLILPAPLNSLHYDRLLPSETKSKTDMIDDMIDKLGSDDVDEIESLIESIRSNQVTQEQVANNIKKDFVDNEGNLIISQKIVDTKAEALINERQYILEQLENKLKQLQ